MLIARRFHPRPASPATTDEVVLDWDARRRQRLRARLTNGEDIGVILPRGAVLADGDELETEDGRRVRVRAALEQLSLVTVEDSLLFARVAYHLGNRHVPLQIEPGRLLYQHDHVLDDLARRLGGSVSFIDAVFTPEGGAYDHSHSHDHSNDHSHSHDHDDDHAHADDAHGRDHD